MSTLPDRASAPVFSLVLVARDLMSRMPSFGGVVDEGERTLPRGNVFGQIFSNVFGNAR